MVDKASFGKKHRCPYCGIRFYDMNKHPVICPKCGKNLEEDWVEPEIEEPVDEAADITVGTDEVLDVEGVEELLDSTPIEPKIADDDTDWQDDI